MRRRLQNKKGALGILMLRLMFDTFLAVQKQNPILELPESCQAYLLFFLLRWRLKRKVGRSLSCHSDRRSERVPLEMAAQPGGQQNMAIMLLLMPFVLHVVLCIVLSSTSNRTRPCNYTRSFLLYVGAVSGRVALRRSSPTACF